MTIILFSCEKEKEKDDPIEPELSNPYALPWSTKYIHYKNINMCCGYHSTGYKVYYKDSLIMQDCYWNDAIYISDSLLVNDTILDIFILTSTNGFAMMTKNGGISWEQFDFGPPIIYKIHYVKEDLVYCITSVHNVLFFSGIGESSLSVYPDTMTNGRHYILDTATNVVNIDSTLITINDSIDYVIKFNE